MSRDFFIVSAIVSTFSPLLPLFIYWRTKGLQPPYMIYLVLLLVASLLADVAGMANSLYFKAKLVNETTSYLYYFSSILLAYLFYRVQFPSRFRVFFTSFIVALFIVYGYWLFVNPMIVTRHESKVPVGLLFIGLSLTYFYTLIRKMPSVHVQRVPMFWISSGLLIYSSGTLILFIISNYLIYVLRKDLLEYWVFHNLLNTLCHVLIAIGLSRVTSHALNS